MKLPYLIMQKNRVLSGLGSLLIVFLTGCLVSRQPVIPTVNATEQPIEKPKADREIIHEPKETSTATPTPVANSVSSESTPFSEDTPTADLQASVTNTPTAEKVPVTSIPVASKEAENRNGNELGPAGYALRFFGTGSDDVDRVKIRLDDPDTNAPGPPADVGATDFTLEWWMRADLTANQAPPIECGPDIGDWIYGNIIFDRDRFDQDRTFGISLAGERIVFGVSGDGTGDSTLCSTSKVADGQWHHIAVQRRRLDGWMWLYVDGNLESQADGPDGDISYPDDGVPTVREDVYCQGPDDSWGGVCQNDPYLVIGAEKHDAGADDGTRDYPSYNGFIDEVRLSTVLRYSTNFSRPTAPFQSDADTAALWHFDEGTGELANDAAFGGENVGLVKVGGPQQGPQWIVSDAPLDR
jgi:hypothetical protein